MKRIIFACLFLLNFCLLQAQVFTEDFNRANSTTVGNGWSEFETGTSGAQIISNRLQLGSTTAGREFVVRDVSALYQTNGLTNNTGIITWAFNVRQSRTDPSGFGGSSYGVAFVLGKTTNLIDDGNGYAVVIGQSGGTDAIRLTRFTNGLDANANHNNIISGNDYGNEFISVKVTFHPVTEEWALYAESNASAFPQTNPALTSTQIGVATGNAVYTGTGTDLKYMGAFWRHGTSASDNAVFDDISVSITPVTYYPRTTASDLSLPSAWTNDPLGISGGSPADFLSAYQLFHLNDNVSSPTVNAGWAIGGGSNLILHNTAPLVFTSEASFRVGNGSHADFNGRPVIFRSAPGGTAYLGTLTGTLAGATNVTVERYISSLNNRAYRLLAPGVNTSTTIRQNWQENGSNAPGYGTHITGSSTGANGFDATQTGQPSLYILDPLTFNYVPLSNTDVSLLEARKGYLLFVRGDRTVDLSSTASPMPSTNTTLRATGTLLTGEQKFSGLAGNEEFSLVTNPYAAPINWANVQAASTNLQASYTLWDPNVGVNGGYVTVATDGSSSHFGVSPASVHIQSGQAFFVQATPGAAYAEMKVLETHKSTTNNVDVFRTGTHTEIFASALFYRDAANNRVNADAVTTYFNNSYASAVDGNDASQIPNWEEDVAIVRGLYELSIERRPLIDAGDTIPFLLSRLKPQAYEWQFTAANFDHPNLHAVLVDQFLNTRTPIQLNNVTTIAFTVTGNPASAAPDRFLVVFEQNSILAVNISSARAYQKGKDIQVEWRVQSEMNTESYEVEKSPDGRQFLKAATQSANNSGLAVNYAWTDINAAAGTQYYRIKAIGKGGEIRYSQVMKVMTGRGNYGISVYPNPVSGNSLTLAVNLPKGHYTIRLTNHQGQEVHREDWRHQGDAATRTVQPVADLAQGVYLLTVSDGRNRHVQSVVKN